MSITLRPAELKRCMGANVSYASLHRDMPALKIRGLLAAAPPVGSCHFLLL
jgi:hypothetical protein